MSLEVAKEKPEGYAVPSGCVCNCAYSAVRLFSRLGLSGGDGAPAFVQLFQKRNDLADHLRVGLGVRL